MLRRTTGYSTKYDAALIIMTNHQPVPRLSFGAAALCALGTMLPGAVAGLRSGPDLLSDGLLNPDSAMRLVRIEDIVAAHSPLHAVLRDASGSGAIMSWSHLMDSLLLLLASPFAAILGWHAALHGAGLAWGLLGMAGLGVAIGWAAAPVASRGWLWVGAFAAGAVPAVIAYGMLGVVHHHIPLAIAAVMTAGWTIRLLQGHDPLGGGIALGAWTAAGLWLSPEALPFTLMATGALWVDWLVSNDRSRARALLAAGVTMTVLVTLAWLVDPPAAGLLAVEPDRISMPFVLLSLGAALTATLAAAGMARAVTILAGAALGAAWLAAFPQVLHGTGGLMTADQASAFFGPITEMQPITSLDGALGDLAGGVFAVLALLALAWRHRAQAAPILYAPILYAALCTAVLLTFATLHVRFATYPAVAGAIMLPVTLSAISASAAPALLQSLARLACLATLVGAPVLSPLAAVAKPTTTGSTGASLTCPLTGAVALLGLHPGAVVLTDVNDGPDLLYRTQIVTVGSLYHRNIEAFMRLRAAWRSIPTDEGATPELRATRATLILACPHAATSMIVEGLGRDTLLSRLIDDSPPPWLHRLADAGPGGYVLYGIAR